MNSQSYRWWQVVIVGLVVQCSSGCRSLKSGRQTRELAAARQFSLRGADALQQKKYSDAEALFTEAIRRSPADERAQWGMAEVLWEKGNRSAATEHMESAAEISGENPELLVRLGQMHLREGNLDAAMNKATKALEGNRQHAEAWALQGQVLTQKNELQAAVQCYHRALIAQPNSPDVQVALADVYFELERPQRALATLDRIADASPDEMISAKAWMLKGQALAALGESWESQKCLREAAVCVKDDNPELLLQLAEAQLVSGDLAEARICLGRALRRDPQNPSALQLQAALDQRFNDFSDQQNLRVFTVGSSGSVVAPK